MYFWIEMPLPLTKHHAIEPYDWLRYVLQTIPCCQTLAEFEALLPYNIDRNLLVVGIN